MKLTKEFLYEQYDSLNWENQMNTNVNSIINNYIIKILLSRNLFKINIFDIGFGNGLLFRTIASGKEFEKIKLHLAGCEPSEKNFRYFTEHPLHSSPNITVNIQNSDFLNAAFDDKFDFITSVYSFPHIPLEDVETAAQKIREMLKENGVFILVAANFKFLETLIENNRDLLIERRQIEYQNQNFTEITHYSKLSDIGTIVDINRQAGFYEKVFDSAGFILESEKEIEDNGFICTVFVFRKK